MGNPVKISLQSLHAGSISTQEAAGFIVDFLIPEGSDTDQNDSGLFRQQALAYLEQLLASRSVFDPTSLVVHLRALLVESPRDRESLGEFAGRFLNAAGCKFFSTCTNCH